MKGVRQRGERETTGLDRGERKGGKDRARIRTQNNMATTIDDRQELLEQFQAVSPGLSSYLLTRARNNSNRRGEGLGGPEGGAANFFPALFRAGCRAGPSPPAAGCRAAPRRAVSYRSPVLSAPRSLSRGNPPSCERAAPGVAALPRRNHAAAAAAVSRPSPAHPVRNPGLRAGTFPPAALVYLRPPPSSLQLFRINHRSRFTSFQFQINHCNSS